MVSDFLTIFKSGRELVEEGGGWSTCVVTYSFNLLNNPTTVLLNWLKLEYYKDRLAIFQLNNCLHNIPILSHSVCSTAPLPSLSKDRPSQWILDLNGHCKTKQVLFTMRVFLLSSQVCKSPTLAHTSATPEKTVWPETRHYLF